MFGRWVEPAWKKKSGAPFVHIVFGVRQTGESTLLKKPRPGARHLLTFLNEHPKGAKHGYIVSMCQAPLGLHAEVTALPWFGLLTGGRIEF